VDLVTMPPLVLVEVAERLEQYDRVAFASTCTAFRQAIADAESRTEKERRQKKMLVTDLTKAKLLSKAPCFSLDWFKWVHGSFDRREGAAPYRFVDQSPGERRALYDSDLMMLAAFQGSMETLKWLRSRGMPLDIKDWKCGCRAAAGGHIELLEWLRSEGYVFSEVTSTWAAAAGKLETVKWLRRQDPPCPLNADICLDAAFFGHLHVLRWARAQGCSWSYWYCFRAAAQQAGRSPRHEKILRWIGEQRETEGTESGEKSEVEDWD